MINAASSRLQTNRVIESKNTSFTVTHLVLKIKEVPSKTENGWKMTGHIRCRRSFQRTSEPNLVRQRPSLDCSSLQVFSCCNSIFPGVILALLLHGLFSFNYVHCKLDLLLAPTARQSDRHRRAGGQAGFSRRRSTEQRRRRSWNCGAPSASAQQSNGSFTCDWQKENVKKDQCREKHEKGRSGCQLGKALDEDERKLGCLRHRWAKRPRPDVLIADSLAQNKPVVSSRHHNKELKRDPKTTRQQTAATSIGKTELESSG